VVFGLLPTMPFTTDALSKWRKIVSAALGCGRRRPTASSGSISPPRRRVLAQRLQLDRRVGLLVRDWRSQVASGRAFELASAGMRSDSACL
jgi:hypothetical protein